MIDIDAAARNSTEPTIPPEMAQFFDVLVDLVSKRVMADLRGHIRAVLIGALTSDESDSERVPEKTGTAL